MALRSSGDDDLRDRRISGYESARPDVQRHVPATVENILELGCSVGALSAGIKQRQRARVLGVEIDEDYARDAAGRLDRVIASSAEDFIASGRPAEAPFDCLICADVLEHLVAPADVLRDAVEFLAPGAWVVISVPNVLYWPQFRRVLAGDWPEDDEGIFDRTHLRWFTPRSVLRLASEAELVDVTVHPQTWPIRPPFNVVSWILNRVGLRRFTSAQLILTARKAST